jgi:2-polyprenyl-6-methoxyphenol hydroxylase-like FAD-dependent oxidoreductase
MSDSRPTPQTGGGNTSAPVIIAGAGPVGLSLALALARVGVKNDRLEPYSRAILIPARTLDIFQGWGMLDAITREGIFSPRLQAYAAESGAVAISIDFSEIRDLTANSGFLFLPQDRTETHLFESLQSTGRSRVRFRTSVSGFVQDQHGVTVEALEDYSRRTFMCRYLIGCDGGHSFVRPHLGLELAGKTYKTRFLIADVAFKDDVSLPTPRIALRARGPLVMLRFDKSRWRIVGTVITEEWEDGWRHGMTRRRACAWARRNCRLIS